MWLQRLTRTIGSRTSSSFRRCRPSDGVVLWASDPHGHMAKSSHTIFLLLLLHLVFESASFQNSSEETSFLALETEREGLWFFSVSLDDDL